MLLSCEDNTQALMEINADRQDPLGVATNIYALVLDHPLGYMSKKIYKTN